MAKYNVEVIASNPIGLIVDEKVRKVSFRCKSCLHEFRCIVVKEPDGEQVEYNCCPFCGELIKEKE